MLAALLQTGEEVTILNPAQVINKSCLFFFYDLTSYFDHLKFPEGAREYYEPVVLGTLVFPAEYLGKIIKLCGVGLSLTFVTQTGYLLCFKDRRGVQKDLIFLDQTRVLLKYVLPLSEVVLDFYDQIKTISSGYAR